MTILNCTQKFITKYNDLLIERHSETKQHVNKAPEKMIENKHANCNKHLKFGVLTKN